jgi:hypothetical protein
LIEALRTEVAARHGYDALLAVRALLLGLENNVDLSGQRKITAVIDMTSTSGLPIQVIIHLGRLAYVFPRILQPRR